MAKDLDLKVKITAELDEIKAGLAGLKVDLDKVGAAGKKSGKDGSQGLSQMERTIGSIRAQVVGLVASFSALYGLKTFVGITDEAKQLEGKLRQVIKTEEELVRVQKQLRDISEETRTSYASTVDIYAKLARSTEKLGLSNQQLAVLTEQINKLGTNSQTPVDSLNAALFQFGQSLESGVFQAEELNSVLDGAPALARAIRDGIQETGVGVGKTLKQMSADGELTVDRVLNAILRMRERTEADFAKVPQQAGTALQSLSDEWKKLVTEFDKETGISDAIISGITWLRENLPEVIETARNLAIALAAAFAPAIASRIAFIITSLLQMQAELRASVVAVGKLQAAFLGLAAFIIGWEIGDYLRNKFQVVEKTGIAMAAGIHKALVKAWGLIKAGAQTMVGGILTGLDDIRTAGADLLTSLADYARAVPGFGDAVADAMLSAADKIRPEGEGGKAMLEAAKQTREQTDAELARIDESYQALFDSVGKNQQKLVGPSGAVEFIPETPAEPSEKDRKKAEDERRRKAAELADQAKRELEERQRIAEQVRRDTAELQIDLARIEGRSMDARMLELQQKYDETMKRLQETGNTEGIKLLQKMFPQEVAQAQFDDIQSKFDKLLADLQAKEESLANLVRIGDITQAQADKELEASRARALEEGGGLLGQQQTIAAANPQLAEQLNRNKEALDQNKASATGLTLAMQELDNSVTQMEQNFVLASFSLLADGIGQAFGDMISGAKTAKQAFDDMARGFAQSIAKMAAEYLAKKAILSLFGPAGGAAGGGGGGGLFAGLFHTGGIVGQGGVIRSVNPALFAMAPRYHAGGVAGLKPGEVPAILKRGEEVLTQNDPRHAANGGGQPAGGGVRIINSIDPNLVADYMSSSQGEQIFVNVIQRNAGAIKQALA